MVPGFFRKWCQKGQWVSGAERRRVFELPFPVWSAANDIQSVSGKIGFLLSAGYFKAARRFFLTADFHDRDIAYVAARLGIDASGFDRKKKDRITKLLDELDRLTASDD